MTLHFVDGLPLAGSSLLCNVLAQNPRFAVTGTSGILEILVQTRNHWDELAEFRTMPWTESEVIKLNVMRGIIAGRFQGEKRPVWFDKSRGWLAHAELAQAILNRLPRILVPVRDMRDVLASFEKVWRASSGTFGLADEKANYMQFQTLEGRLAVWSGAGSPLGLAYNRIKDALQRGWQQSMLFVPYERLTAEPQAMMDAIYTFLDEEPFHHDFKNVVQVTTEDDVAYGFPPESLHTIRRVIQPQSPQWPIILGDVAMKYANQEVW